MTKRIKSHKCWVLLKGPFLPVKYLGVPLSTKKPSIAQCKPLIDKIVAKITSWCARFLSYVRRLQLIKAVLLGIQAYWAQIFLLPKRVLKMIEATCRSLNGQDLPPSQKKAVVSWEKICLPNYQKKKFVCQSVLEERI